MILTIGRYYGIEAAYKTIVQEVTNVFGVYGIKVDYRYEEERSSPERRSLRYNNKKCSGRNVEV